jgi:hypothetical protein
MTQLAMFVPPIWRRSVSHHSRRDERLRTRCSVRFPTQPSKRVERTSPQFLGESHSPMKKGSCATPELRPVRLTGSHPSRTNRSAGEHGLREARRTTQLAMFVPPICRRRR